MKFFTSSSTGSERRTEREYESYIRYLNDNRHLFPTEAFDFAAAEWHYDASDHRCPHDSWVESLEIVERGETISSESRHIDIHLTLLGAYHDGTLSIRYEKVSYKLDLAPDELRQPKTHGDWLIDEIRLSGGRRVVHEINFWRNGTWMIECDNIHAEWLPNS